jgi:hypothetical protein
MNSNRALRRQSNDGELGTSHACDASLFNPQRGRSKKRKEVRESAAKPIQKLEIYIACDSPYRKAAIERLYASIDWNLGGRAQAAVN